MSQKIFSQELVCHGGLPANINYNQSNNDENKRKNLLKNVNFSSCVYIKHYSNNHAKRDRNDNINGQIHKIKGGKTKNTKYNKRENN